MFTIYRATNSINGKSYVGFDRNWPYRKTAHKCAVKKGSKQVFYNAIRKYGWENFIWEVLEQSEDKELLLKEKEEYYIRKYNTHYKSGYGYNMTYGGEGTFGWIPSAETKQKISESKKGKPSWNKGKLSPWLVESNKKRKGMKQPKLCKKYLVIDPNGNKYEVTGLKYFCVEHGLSQSNLTYHGKYKGWQCTPIQ